MNTSQRLLLSLGLHWQHTLHVPEDLRELYERWKCAPTFVQALAALGVDPVELVMPLVRFEQVSPTLATKLKTERWRNGTCLAEQAFSEVAIACRTIGDSAVMGLYKHHFPYSMFMSTLKRFLSDMTTNTVENPSQVDSVTTESDN